MVEILRGYARGNVKVAIIRCSPLTEPFIRSKTMTEIERRFLDAMDEKRNVIGGTPTPYGEVQILEAGVRKLVEIIEEVVNAKRTNS